jgi:glyoxylate reductase
MSYNILVTRKIPQPGIDLLQSFCEKVDIHPEDRPMTKSELLEKVQGRDGILCLLTDTIDEEIITAAGDARIFANYAVGFNNIDVQAATRQGIMVTNTPGVLTDATADLTWALILSSARRIAESDRYTRAGNFTSWGPMLLLGAGVAGKTLGIVGAGRIGTAVAQRAAGFRMRILYSDEKVYPDLEKSLGAVKVSLSDLLTQSDFISLHVPLLPETKHLIGQDEFQKMKSTAFLINTSRGPVVDEEALVQALTNHDIAGAGLDVYEKEPALTEGLKELNNVVLLPHLGSATVEARTKMAVMAAENLVAGLKGDRPPNLVNPEVLKR